MSFRVNWPSFSPDFLSNLKKSLEKALNSASSATTRSSSGKNSIEPVPGEISVAELDLGDTAPELEILDIKELGKDLSKILFHVKYFGEARILLQTNVQVNPLLVVEQSSSAKSSLRSPMTRPGFVAAHRPLLLPLTITICDLDFDGKFILTLDSSKGTFLHFQGDPLKHVRVKSSLDQIKNVRDTLQSLIEQQMRKCILEDLPSWNLFTALKSSDPLGESRSQSHPEASKSQSLTLVRHHSLQDFDRKQNIRRSSSPAVNKNQLQSGEQYFTRLRSESFMAETPATIKGSVSETRAKIISTGLQEVFRLTANDQSKKQVIMARSVSFPSKLDKVGNATKMTPLITRKVSDPLASHSNSTDLLQSEDVKSTRVQETWQNRFTMSPLSSHRRSMDNTRSIRRRTSSSFVPMHTNFSVSSPTFSTSRSSRIRSRTFSSQPFQVRKGDTVD